jgi:hypothetical protein
LANHIGSTCGYPQSDGFRKGSTHPTFYGFAKNERDNIDDKTGYVSQLEWGTKRPTGAALVLLNVIRRKGIEIVL